MQQTLSSLKIIFREPLYRKVAIVGSLIAGLLSYWLFYKNTTIPAFIQMAQNGELGSYSIPYAVLYAVTTFAVIILSGVSVAAAVWLYRHSKLGYRQGLFANTGGFGAAMLGMGCPVCGAFLLSALGVAGGLTIFPFQGLELKFLSLGLLAGSTYYAARKVPKAQVCKDCGDSAHESSNAQVCEDCGDVAHATRPRVASAVESRPLGNSVVLENPRKLVVLPLEKIFITALIALFASNQFLIDRASVAIGAPSSGGGGFLNVSGASASTIIAPKLNADGRTTTLAEFPTLTEVPANPNTGNALADAKVVMLATGKPFYAPEDISFDDPINAQKKWGAHERSIQLTGDLQARYDTLISTMVCSYCCGGPTNVTVIKQCGCAHAKAVRGFYKYMLQNYGDQYSNEQLVGESHRWYAIWYPKGMLEDYLLVTGNDSALPHKTHGGAGTDGRHGL